MKKTLLSMLMMASCCSIANAQLMVDENGRVGVGIESNDTLYSRLTLNSRGKTNSEVLFASNNTNTLYVTRGIPTQNPNFTTGLTCLNTVAQGMHNAAIYASSMGSVGSGGASIGVFGGSSTGASQCNAGVYGMLQTPASAKGAAILGNASGSSLFYINPTGRYAGFFYGDTRVTGTLTAGAVVTSSDYRLKKNIRSLSSSDACLNRIMALNVVEFDNIQREFETNEEDAMVLTMMDSASIQPIAGNKKDKANWYEEGSPIINNKHYGLIAQELQEIYPDLVVESQDGFLAINYIEIIPLLIRSVQELKAEINTLQAGNAPVYKAQGRTTDVTSLDAVVTALYQNEPNPFTERTVIRVDVAEDVSIANLYIYNMNGEQLTEYPITERGATSVTIDGGSLNAGMYLYALIADGKVIDTKRMILTK